MALWDDQDKVVAVTLMLADGNPLMLTALSEIFEKDRRFSLVATAATAERTRRRRGRRARSEGSPRAVLGRACRCRLATPTGAEVVGARPVMSGAGDCHGSVCCRCRASRPCADVPVFYMF